MVYDHQSKSSSWTPTPRKSSFFPPSHIQTKTEAKKGSELVGKLPSKAQRDKIRRSLFGDIPEMTGAKAETAPTEAKEVENPTQVSEEAASGEIQAKAETGLSQSQGYGVPSREVRNKIRRRLLGNLEQTPVQKHEEGTSPPTPLLQGEGSMDDAGGKEKGLAETEITLPIQAKLTIGEPNDVYEQEADRVARQVVDKIHSPTPETVQRQEMGDEDEVRLKSDAGSGGKVEAGVGVTGVRKSPIEGVRVNRKVNSEGETSEASAQLEASIQGKRGSGQPLDESVREPMEREFGADFSGVRVHTDTQSDELNQAIQAKAFTTGEDIFFREGAYEPGSRGGKELLAHELTHVVQQSGEAVQRTPLTPEQQEQTDKQGNRKISVSEGIKEEAGTIQRKVITEDEKELIEVTITGTGRSVNLNYSDGREGSKQVTYPMKLYEMFLGHFVDLKTAYNAESEYLANFGNKVGAKKLAKGVKRKKNKKDKEEWYHEDCWWMTQPNNQYWPFLLSIKTKYGIKESPKKNVIGIHTHRIIVQFAQDKYGYVIQVNDEGRNTENKMVVGEEPKKGEYSSLHDVQYGTDLYLRSLIARERTDIDNLTKVLAEGARWVAIDQIRRQMKLQDDSRFYPARRADGHSWREGDMVPYVTLMDLWTSWNKFKREWKITNEKLAQLIHAGKVKTGKEEYSHIAQLAYATDRQEKIIMAGNP